MTGTLTHAPTEEPDCLHNAGTEPLLRATARSVTGNSLANCRAASQRPRCPPRLAGVFEPALRRRGGSKRPAHPSVAERAAAGSVVAGPRTYDPLRSVRTPGP
ncbi:hypothetical protein GCM10018771_66120 [Streptomyces cellulosae]|nr:hypothetical protein GCM10018771_66120 [Streptomyces cellulosae]